MKNNKNIKQVEYDGYTFYISLISLKNKSDIIGFYFDLTDYVQEIRYDSVFGMGVRRMLE